jgi:hypothetical protein
MSVLKIRLEKAIELMSLEFDKALEVGEADVAVMAETVMRQIDPDNNFILERRPEGLRQLETLAMLFFDQQDPDVNYGLQLVYPPVTGGEVNDNMDDEQWLVPPTSDLVSTTIERSREEVEAFVEQVCAARKVARRHAETLGECGRRKAAGQFDEEYRASDC